VKLILENWRQHLLNEVSFADAKEILNSKRTMKIIKNYEYEREKTAKQKRSRSWTDIYAGEAGDDAENFLERPSGKRTAYYHRMFKDWLLETIPDDLTDNQKGLAVLWLIKLSREDSNVAAAFIGAESSYRRSKYGKLWASFETFFHHQRFMPQQDLMQVKSIDDFHQMAEDAQEEIQAHQKGKEYLDVEAGTEVLRDDELWFIAALHNKGAACELGKGTNWCTAAPGLDYFEDYYEPEDPLFYIEVRRGGDLPNIKYQFHYGTEQFMDEHDTDVTDEKFQQLHSLLMQTEAPKKYPVVQAWHWEEVAGNETTPPEELAAMAENPDIPESVLWSIAKNPNTPLKTLEKLARSDNKYIKRSVQVNPSIDVGLAIELFVENPQDDLMYQRGISDLYGFVQTGEVADEQANQIIDDVHRAHRAAGYSKEAGRPQAAKIFENWRKYLNETPT